MTEPGTFGTSEHREKIAEGRMLIVDAMERRTITSETAKACLGLLDVELCQSEDLRTVRQLLLDFVPVNALGDAMERLDRVSFYMRKQLERNAQFAPIRTTVQVAPVLLLIGEPREPVTVYSVEQAAEHISGTDLAAAREFFEQTPGGRLQLRWEPES